MDTPLTPAASAGLSPARRYLTLLQREWMQHRLGWTLLAGAPLLVSLLVLLVGRLQVTFNGDDVTLKLGDAPTLAVATLSLVGTTVLSFILAWFVSLWQASGLARRDQQDRSIEFWLSLPISHTAALTAPMVAHLLLFPLAALWVGVAGGTLVSLVAVTAYAPPSEWLALPWGWIALAVVSIALRITLGLLLATLWLSPLILAVMAASAWLKRWGLPALIATVAIVGNLLEGLQGSRILWDTGKQLMERAGQSFITSAAGHGVRFGPDQPDATPMLRAVPGELLTDAGRAVAQLADPLLPLALLVAAGCFALLLVRRRQGA